MITTHRPTYSSPDGRAQLACSCGFVTQVNDFAGLTTVQEVVFLKHVLSELCHTITEMKTEILELKRPKTTVFEVIEPRYGSREG